MKDSELLQSGRDFYDGLYSQDVAEEARWLEFGVPSKTDSIEQLLARAGIKPRSVLEIGCGTGGILRELQRREIGTELFGVDYSESAISYARSESRGIEYFSGDVTDSGLALPREHFDVVVVSHVLEHLENPGELLSKMKRLSFGAMIAEVPLDDLPVSRLKGLVRDRRVNFAGHVQFFTARSFRKLLVANGFRIFCARRYTPVSSLESIRFASRRNRASRLRALFSEAVGHYFPKYVPLWSQLYYAHYAALCMK